MERVRTQDFPEKNESHFEPLLSISICKKGKISAARDGYFTPSWLFSWLAWCEKSMRVGYFLAILENELFLRFLGRFYDFLLKINIFVRKSTLQLISLYKNLTKKLAVFGQIWAKSGYLQRSLCAHKKTFWDTGNSNERDVENIENVKDVCSIRSFCAR